MAIEDGTPLPIISHFVPDNHHSDGILPVVSAPFSRKTTGILPTSADYAQAIIAKHRSDHIRRLVLRRVQLLLYDENRNVGVWSVCHIGQVLRPFVE